MKNFITKYVLNKKCWQPFASILFILFGVALGLILFDPEFTFSDWKMCLGVFALLSIWIIDFSPPFTCFVKDNPHLKKPLDHYIWILLITYISVIVFF